MSDVVEIVWQLFQLVFAGTAISIVHLRPASQSRFDSQAVAIQRIGFFQFKGILFSLWAWSYQTHLTTQDIEHLRQLIQVQSTQESSNSCHSRILLDCPSLMPYAFLTVKDRA